MQEAHVQDSLEKPAPRFYPQTEMLEIPMVDETNVEFDRATSTIQLDFGLNVPDGASATSIAGMDSFTMSTDQARTFAHDFTFSLFSSELDKRFRDVFPSLNDGCDNNTPDLFIVSNELCLLLEFGTTKNSQAGAMIRVYESKQYKYQAAMSRRVAKVRNVLEPGRYYGFIPIIVSERAVVTASTLHLPPNIVNELCARYRFSLGIMAVLDQLAVPLGDSTTSQLETDVNEIIESIKPRYQLDGDRRVALTLERLDTSEMTRKQAMEFSMRSYIHSLRKAGPGISSRGDELSVCELEKMYVKDDEPKRRDLKPILNLPTFVPRRATNWMPTSAPTADNYGSFLNSIITQTEKDEWRKEETEEEMIEKAMRTIPYSSEDAVSQTRRQYKRVKVPLDSHTRLIFAKDGVQAKALEENLELQEASRLKKLPFSYHTYTGDVDHFLENDHLKLSSTGDHPLEWEMVRPLILTALDLHQEKSSSELDVIDRLARTNEFKWCNFISNVAIELAISLKQNVNRDEWIVKKLRNYDALLVIKPTKSESHIFYTIIMPLDSTQVLPEGIGKRMIINAEWMYMPWSSFSLSKLVNAIKADVFFLSMVFQWSRHYGLLSSELEDNPEISKMVKISLLVHLEDKPLTEEIMTLFRYISMEKFSMVGVDNTKMLEKLPQVLRSRLQVWSVKRMIMAAADPHYKPQTIPDESTCKDGSEPTSNMRKWENMINPYTRGRVDSPHQLIELYYVGYATNKDAKTWGNAEFNLVKKIIKYEQELDNADPNRCGLTDEVGYEQKFHEWSRSQIVAMAEHTKEYLRRAHGGQYENRISEKIIFRLSRITWEEVASLKASSLFDPNTDGDLKQETLSTQRVKVVIAILKNWGHLSDTPAKSIKSILEWVDADGGLRVDLFKKNQHGGLREIYVLHIYSRVVQLMLEEISRAICDELPIEMMMHPQNKVRKPQEHIYNAAKDPSQHKFNVSSSNDAKVWNQGHHVAKFAQYMCRLLPRKFHGLIVNGLKQWTTKRIKLPEGVLSQLLKRPLTPLADPIHEEIRLTYLGLKENRWMKRGHNYITVESGMMQGILHYMSSAFHASLLMLRDDHWKKISYIKGIRSMTTDLVSSDDSSRLTDVFAEDAKQLRRARAFAQVDHRAIKTFSTTAGIHMSPKSTYCTNGVVEFNSEYLVRANHYRPTLKWVYAALSITEVESLVERQEVLYNQVTELLEGGAGFKLTHAVQMCQALLHYKLMGSTSNPLFWRYTVRLRSLPDPALGFFLVDHPLIAGLPGFSYNLWTAINRFSSVSRLYKSIMSQGDMTSTTTGTITRGCQIRYGNRKKMLRLLGEAEQVSPDWREAIEADPEVLYTVARDLKSAAIKILTKLTSPSVIQSMSKSNSIGRMVASSVYLISGIATTLGSNWSALKENDRYGRIKKVSLWNLIHMDVETTPELTESELRLLFPHQEHFRHMLRVVRSLQDMKLVHVGSTKMLRSHVQVYPESNVSLISLERMVRWRWFGESVQTSRVVADEVWETWKRLLPWLGDDPHSTLKDPRCHFEGQIQLRNFIARQETRSRVVHLTGAPIRDDSTKDLLYTSIIKNQQMGYSLVRPDAQQIPTRETDLLLGRLASALTFPLCEAVMEDTVKKMLLQSSDIWDGTGGLPSMRRLQLAIIQKVYKLKEDTTRASPLKSLEIRNYIKRSKLGVIGGFTKRQVSQDGTWRGMGEWVGVLGSVSIMLVIKNDTLVRMETSNLERLGENIPLLNKLVQEFGLVKLGNGYGDFYYDGTRLNYRGTGCPVTELRTLNYEPCFTEHNFEIKVSPGNIRLVSMADDFSGQFTVVSFRPTSWDFRYTQRTSTSYGFLLNCWLNNEPLPAKVAEDILQKVMENQPAKILDPLAFLDFARESLPQAFARAGWNFHGQLGRDYSSIYIPQPEECFDDVFEDFDDFDFDEEQLAEMIEAELDLDTVDYNELEFDVQDFLAGGLDSYSPRQTVYDLRKTHRFWEEFVEKCGRDLSRKQQSTLEGGFIISGRDLLVNVLTRILGFPLREEQQDEVVEAEVDIDDLY